MKAQISMLFKTLQIVALLALPAMGSIEDTPHDLTVLGGRKNICSYCHTPHGSMSKVSGWSRELSTAVYQIYQSSSLEAKVGQPTGSSKLCLCCHDGTVALTKTLKGDKKEAFILPGASNLGTDLSDDHPISFIYSEALSAEDVQILPALSLPESLKLDPSGELQCTTCHEPHDNKFGNFMVMSNRESAMCISCHNVTGWQTTIHKYSTASVAGTNDEYLRDNDYLTVAENGCLGCHRPHSAGGHERLLHFSKSEDNCLNCHDGSVARTNLISELSKFSRHDVKRYDGIHDLKELASSSPMHVECADCHNPHAIQDVSAQAPFVSGAMKGVSGITTSGSTTYNVQYEYEVCFKCHGDNPDRATSMITRQITQTNTRLEFSPSNPSFHPVVSRGINQNVPSLKPPMTVASLIYCTDCHNSDNTSGTKGPHGSNYPNLLAYRYETSDFTQESEFSYELCYKCHSRNSILNDESFPKHSKHLEEEIPCSVCHDAHGISSAQGTSLNNSFLINFDTTIVGPDSSGLLMFEKQLGVYSGKCHVKCHGTEHSPAEY